MRPFSRLSTTGSPIQAAIGLVAVTLAAAGCGSSRPEAELSRYSFRPTTAPSTSSTPSTPSAAPTAKPPVLAVRGAWTLQNPAPSVSAEPALPAVPTTTPVAGNSSGQYQTVGGVVSEVNGIPIYANRVLRALRAELAARALEMDPEQFRNFATGEIGKKINGMERDELVFGAADRNLPDDEKQLAEFLTMQWRTRQITESGGSVEMTQRKAKADGFDLEELVFDQYRKYMTEVYYRKKVVPRIQITANDMREYFQANLDREFTEYAEATFRLIKVDPKKLGGKAQAVAKAKEILGKAQTADFAVLAQTMNDDSRLAKAAGVEMPVQKGAYKLEKVDAALWTAPIGQAIGPVEDAGAYYIIKVESRKGGTVEDFNNQKVQDRIYKTLWARQFRTLTEQIEMRLRANAMVRDSREMFNIAVQMAMQNYARWSKGEMDM